MNISCTIQLTKDNLNLRPLLRQTKTFNSCCVQNVKSNIKIDLLLLIPYMVEISLIDFI